MKIFLRNRYIDLEKIMDGIDEENIICCFCGKQEKYCEALSLSIKALGDEAEVQNLFSHRACLRKNIIDSIPLHPNFETQRM